MNVWRSLIFVGGNRQEDLLAALDSPVDGVVLDLEDLVPHEHKEKTRHMVVENLKTLDFKGKIRIVRINGLDTPYGRADVEAIMSADPAAIRLPKAERVEDVKELDRLMSDFQGAAAASARIILAVESPLGLVNSYQLATASKRVAAIGPGGEDFTTGLKTSRSSGGLQIELLYARQKLVVDGRAAGIDCLDCACLDKQNLEALREETLLAKQLGYDGKLAAHVDQIPVINAVFTPSDQEAAHAHRVLDAFEEGAKQGSYTVFLDGRLIDGPVADKAQTILTRYQAARKNS